MAGEPGVLTDEERVRAMLLHRARWREDGTCRLCSVSADAHGKPCWETDTAIDDKMIAAAITWIAKLRATVSDEHDQGCCGAFGYRCRCGLDERRKDADYGLCGPFGVQEGA